MNSKIGPNMSSQSFITQSANVGESLQNSVSTQHPLVLKTVCKPNASMQIINAELSKQCYMVPVPLMTSTLKYNESIASRSANTNSTLQNQSHVLTTPLPNDMSPNPVSVSLPPANGASIDAVALPVSTTSSTPFHLFFPNNQNALLSIGDHLEKSSPQITSSCSQSIAANNPNHVSSGKNLQANCINKLDQPTSSNSTADSELTTEDLDVSTSAAMDSSLHVRIDDDVEIVGTTQAEIMSHIRSDCPVHLYQKVENVDLPPLNANQKYCSKCYCYICDKLAGQCEQWTASTCPHCNANSKSSCWKARRNTKKSPLMNVLSAEEITPEIRIAGERAMEYVIQIRETYITYRKGIPCEMHLVPCCCSCHRQKKSFCAQCKAIHDLKKMFNYEPVQQTILKVANEINVAYNDQPHCALVLLEALISEVCSHRPPDFNHVLRLPANPVVSRQCRTPHLLNEILQWHLVELFTSHEISSSITKKFLLCLNNSINPLQLNSLMKQFFSMRHWDDILLRSVLSGQNTTGKLKSAQLKESTFVVEMRTKKLMREKRFRAVVRYLNVVRIVTTSNKIENSTTNGTPIMISIKIWTIECLTICGRFREACRVFAGNFSILKLMSVKQALRVFSHLVGKNIPPDTKMVDSFNAKVPSGYQVVNVDLTVVMFLYLIFLESNTGAQSDFSYYLWLAKWLNEEKMAHDQSQSSIWVKSSNEMIERSRTAVCTNFKLSGQSFIDEISLHQHVSTPRQSALFTCSSLIIRFVMSKDLNRFDPVHDLINAYENNNWALFYMFSQPYFLSSANHLLISWLIEFMKSTGNALNRFNPIAFMDLIRKSNFKDVCLFMKQWYSPTWVDHTPQFICYFLQCIDVFSQRMLQESFFHLLEKSYNCSDILKEVTQVIINKNMQNVPALKSFCLQIAEVSLCFNLDDAALCHRVFSFRGRPRRKQVSDVYGYFLHRFKSKILRPDEIAMFLRCSLKANRINEVQTMLNYYVDKHECVDESEITLLLMEEIIKYLESSPAVHSMSNKVMTIYSKLHIHEALSWLICGKCAAKMPNHWTKVWIALERNGMNDSLQSILDQILFKYTLWMKELCVKEASDFERLENCLRIFMSYFARTLVLQCNFDRKALKKRILLKVQNVSNATLQRDFVKVVKQVFKEIKAERPDSTILHPMTSSKSLENSTTAVAWSLTPTVNQQHTAAVAGSKIVAKKPSLAPSTVVFDQLSRDEIKPTQDSIPVEINKKSLKRKAKKSLPDSFSTRYKAIKVDVPAKKSVSSSEEIKKSSNLDATMLNLAVAPSHSFIDSGNKTTLSSEGRELSLVRSENRPPNFPNSLQNLGGISDSSGSENEFAMKEKPVSKRKNAPKTSIMHGSWTKKISCTPSERLSNEFAIKEKPASKLKNARKTSIMQGSWPKKISRSPSEPQSFEYCSLAATGIKANIEFSPQSNIACFINPHWQIPHGTKVPLGTHLPKFCSVHLGAFPSGLMEKILVLQPELHLCSLYA